MEGLLTVREAAELLRLRRETVRRYISSGVLRALVMPGGDYRITEEALRQLLREAGRDESPA